MVTATQSHLVNAFFGDLKELSVKDLVVVNKFQGMRITYDDEDGYGINQEVAIREIVRDNGLEEACSVRTSIGEELSNSQEENVKLPVKNRNSAANIKSFQSLVGSLLSISRSSRPAISYAVHRVSRQTHSPTLGDYILAERVAKYSKGTKTLRLRMYGQYTECDTIRIVGTEMPILLQTGRIETGSRAVGSLLKKCQCNGWQKKQGGVSLSTLEAEFTAASVVVLQMLGIRELLHEIGLKCKEPMILYVDNQAALKQLGGDGSSANSKHVDVRIKFVISHVKSDILIP
uniref:PREDICTED: similar to copiatype polyprotein putative n=1 Tax=Albugo laibachii Nc14 TaxID=890382 RepID=F0WC34_9STRA|nr:PREDICTED: similar to copiatype polyprotein putative [Albugo laibachii Nc14]|eukprot:CCA18746.1 PREDICTED: similar to copiatype polyprotein putative [Albugo laibachii Nc14]